MWGNSHGTERSALAGGFLFPEKTMKKLATGIFCFIVFVGLGNWFTEISAAIYTPANGGNYSLGGLMYFVISRLLSIGLALLISVKLYKKIVSKP